MIIGSNHVAAIGLFSTCGLMLLGLLATYPAVVAYEKKHSFLKWYLFGILLLPVATIASRFLKNPDSSEHMITS